jgi:type IV secretory pathway TrbD component
MRPTGPDRRASRPAAEGGQATVPTVRDCRASRLAAEGGQATVELVALLPVIAVLVAGAWQAALAGHAVWAANAAARAAARAHAVGADPRVAARSHLPRGLERGLRVTAEQGGNVRISVRIPALPGLPSPGRASAVAHFEPQT